VSFEEFNSTLKSKERTIKGAKNALMADFWDTVKFVKGDETAGHIRIDGMDFLARVIDKPDYELAKEA
jgi:hypothetical protein